MRLCFVQPRESFAGVTNEARSRRSLLDMQRRRLGLALAILALAVLIAIKPNTGEIRLSLAMSDSAPTRMEAALKLGTVAISVLIDGAERAAR